MKDGFVTVAACMVLGAAAALPTRAQAPIGYDLTLVDVDGMQKVLGRLPASVYAPAGSPVPLPIKGFAQAEYRRQYDLLPNGKQYVLLFPVMP